MPRCPGLVPRGKKTCDPPGSPVRNRTPPPGIGQISNPPPETLRHYRHATKPLANPRSASIFGHKIAANPTDQNHAEEAPLMAYFERIKDSISAPLQPRAVIRQRTASGWQMVSIEWRREPPDGETPLKASSTKTSPTASASLTTGKRLEADPTSIGCPNGNHGAFSPRTSPTSSSSAPQ